MLYTSRLDTRASYGVPIGEDELRLLRPLSAPLPVILQLSAESVRYLTSLEIHAGAAQAINEHLTVIGIAEWIGCYDRVEV